MCLKAHVDCFLVGGLTSHHLVDQSEQLLKLTDLRVSRLGRDLVEEPLHQSPNHPSLEVVHVNRLISVQGILRLQDHLSLSSLNCTLGIHDISGHSCSTRSEKFRIFKSSHDVVKGKQLDKYHFDHFVQLISHNHILIRVWSGVLLHVDQRKEHIFHLSVKLEVIFLIWI